jgi:MFS family permease
MLPSGIFASRMFSAANAITFLVYAALGGFFFLFVAFLQVTLGYSPLAAGAATLPVTLIMLAFSAKAGAAAQHSGPRVPLTLGSLIIAASLLAMAMLDDSSRYPTSILPMVVGFGGGLTLIVAPVTATVLAAVDSGHVGIASAINNAVARIANLLAVAILPLVAGLTHEDFVDPAKMTDGFQLSMVICAALAALGGAIAWLTISPQVLAVEAEPGGDTPAALGTDYSCAVNGPPVRLGREGD